MKTALQTRTRNTAPLLLSLFLIAGGNVVWYLIFGYITIAFSSFIPEVISDNESEHPAVLDNEDVVIMGQRRDEGKVQNTARTLSGRELSPREVSSLQSRMMEDLPAKRPYISDYAWTRLGFQVPEYDTGRRKMLSFFGADESEVVAWYFVCFNQPASHGYFEAYDLKANRRLFYVGLNGKSETLPTREEQFEFSLSGPFEWAGNGILFLPRQMPQFSDPPKIPARSEQGSYHRLPFIKDALLLGSDQKIRRINLYTGEVKIQPEENEISGLKFSNVFPSWIGVEESRKRNQLADGLLISTEKEVRLFGPDQQVLAFQIPQKLQEKPRDGYNNLSFTPLFDGSILYLTYRIQPQGGPVPGYLISTDLLWADAAGNILREEQEVTKEFKKISLTQELWKSFGIMPHLFGFVASTKLVSHDQIVRYAFLSDDMNAFLFVLRASWPMLLAAGVMSLVSCGLYWFLQRQAGFRFVWWHGLLLLLFGPFALLSLLSQRRTTVPQEFPSNQGMGTSIIRPVVLKV